MTCRLWSPENGLCPKKAFRCWPLLPPARGRSDNIQGSPVSDNTIILHLTKQCWQSAIYCTLRVSVCCGQLRNWPPPAAPCWLDTLQGLRSGFLFGRDAYWSGQLLVAVRLQSEGQMPQVQLPRPSPDADPMTASASCHPFVHDQDLQIPEQLLFSMLEASARSGQVSNVALSGGPDAHPTHA